MVTLFKPRSVVTKKQSSSSAVPATSPSPSLNSTTDKDIQSKGEALGDTNGISVSQQSHDTRPSTSSTVSLNDTAESGRKRELQLREVLLRNRLKRRRLDAQGADKNDVKIQVTSQSSHIHFGTPVPAACHNEVPPDGLVNAPSSLISDDTNDHFIAIPGQILNNHYTIMAKLGSADGIAVKVNNSISSQLTAQIMRRNSECCAAGEHELRVLSLLHASSSPESQYIIPFVDSFTFEDHLCIVMPRIKRSLRQYLSVCPHHAASIDTTLRIAQQVLTALKWTHRHGIIHADIKPDNILLEGEVVKVCDFGAAIIVSELDTTSTSEYAAARYYRAPEVFLSYKAAASPAMDVWAVGLTIVEMLSGRLMFTGRHSNSVLWKIFRMLGPPSATMIANNRSTHISVAVDNSLIFNRLDRDPADASKDIVVPSVIPPTDSTTLLLPMLFRFAKKSKYNQIRDLCDVLIKHILVVDASKRMRANELLHSKLFRENRK